MTLDPAGNIRRAQGRALRIAAPTFCGVSPPERIKRPLQLVRQLVPVESLAGAAGQSAGLERIEKQSMRVAITGRVL